MNKIEQISVKSKWLTDLTANEALVYAYLSDYYARLDVTKRVVLYNESYFTCKDVIIAEFLKISLSSCQRYLRLLEKAEYIKTLRRGNGIRYIKLLR